MLRYTIVVTPEPDESAYNVMVPLLPGCYTCGSTVAEAIENARDAIATFVAALQDVGEEVPVEQLPPWVVAVEVEEPAVV